MEKVLGGLLGEEVFVCIDDILVATQSIERHHYILEKVFQALRSANLNVKRQKCRLLEQQVALLGHVVDAQGVRTDPDKVLNICNFPQLAGR